MKGLPILIMIFVVGCSPTAADQPLSPKEKADKKADMKVDAKGGKPAEVKLKAEAMTLTTEQRSAWERARVRHKKNIVYAYALTGVNTPEWKSVEFEGTSSKPIGSRLSQEIDDDNHPEVPTQLQRVIRSVSALPSTQIVAVVDLFSQKDPVVISWHQSSGDEIKAMKFPPPEAKESLAKHLFSIQQHIGD